MTDKSSFEPTFSFPLRRKEAEMKAIVSAVVAITLASPASAQFTLDTLDRLTVEQFYNERLLSPLVPSGWTGSTPDCNTGTLSRAFSEAQGRVLNAVREFAGVPPIVVDADLNRQALDAALLMSANAERLFAGENAHTPTPAWNCWTPERAQVAFRSNLGVGTGIVGDVVLGFIEDGGDNNAPVGHRRDLLESGHSRMGFGAVPDNAGFVGGVAITLPEGSTPCPRRTRDGFVAWPPPGYFPLPLVPRRWSLFYEVPCVNGVPDFRAADFRSATVTVSRNGSLIPVTIEDRGRSITSIAFVPDSIALAESETTVTISNVLVGDSPRTFTYTVKVFEPVFTETGSAPETGLWCADGWVQCLLVERNGWNMLVVVIGHDALRIPSWAVGVPIPSPLTTSSLLDARPWYPFEEGRRAWSYGRMLFRANDARSGYFWLDTVPQGLPGLGGSPEVLTLGTTDAVAVRRIEFAAGGFAGCLSPGGPLTGFWQNSADPVRGYFLECQQDRLVFIPLTYGEDGRPTWTGNIDRFLGSFTSRLMKWQPRLQGAEDAGQVRADFTSATEGVVTMPDGSRIPIVKMRF
ncbi:hypothetical protein HY504_00325 [Candidatus Wolfebacteria bacterium]|nr:hypothetical protein [Candidatus Wolfebacteria bacterium]